MNNIIKHIDIELYSPSPFEVIRAQQGDNKTRIIEFSLYDQGNPYTIPSNVTFKLEGHRGDNTSFIKDNCCAVRDNKIIVTLDKDILYAHGIVEATIVMYDNTNDNILSTISFRINVQKNPCDKNGLEHDKKSLIDEIILSIEKLKEDFTKHIQNFQNPHKVTKTQVELGNVPNVTTNDQTPTYTESGTLAKLVSGEKLSVAFSKISKAISDLISHIADNTRHITSTERTNWDDAYNKRHTHSNKTVLDNTTASYTTEEKNKLNGIQSGAEVNVQSDWNVSDTNSDAFIKNKPSVYTKNEIDNKFSTLETNIDWKESVETYSDIEKTYPNPQDGWTVNVKDTDYTYRYSGSSWVAISANSIPKATNSVDGLLSKEDHTNYDDANSKKHTHSNKTILDKITQALLDSWDAAYSHISDTVKHITSAERTNWNTVSDKLDKSGGKITGNLKLDKGYMVHQADNTRGTIGYLHICQIKVVEQYIDMPIAFKIFQRGRVGELFVKFAAINNNDPALDWFIKRGNIYAYIVKSATSTWDIYIAKGQSGYDSCEIVELNHPYSDYIQLTWKDATVTSLPSGYREATLDVYPTNITGSATKLATPRQIALSGAVTGSVNFDGSGNATIATLRREANICKETDANQVWFKFASHACGADYTDCSITFLVSAGFGDASLRVGILTAHFRTSGDGVVETRELVWNFANININPDDFILAYNGSNKPATVELWAKLDGNYKGYSFEVLAEKYRTNSANIFTLYDTRQGTNAITSGYTQVKSYLAVIKNTAYASVRDGDGNVISTTYLKKTGVASSAELAYALSVDGAIGSPTKPVYINEEGQPVECTEISSSEVSVKTSYGYFDFGGNISIASKSYVQLQGTFNPASGGEITDKDGFAAVKILNLHLNTSHYLEFPNNSKMDMYYYVLGYKIYNNRIIMIVGVYNNGSSASTFNSNTLPVEVIYMQK